MDILSGLNSTGTKLTLNAANEQYAAQVRAQQQQAKVQEQVRQENERAAADSVEISAEGRALLQQLDSTVPVSK